MPAHRGPQNLHNHRFLMTWDEQIELYHLIADSPGLPIKEVMFRLTMSESKAYDRLRHLKSLGWLRQDSSTRPHLWHANEMR